MASGNYNQMGGMHIDAPGALTATYNPPPRNVRYPSDGPPQIAQPFNESGQNSPYRVDSPDAMTQYLSSLYNQQLANGQLNGQMIDGLDAAARSRNNGMGAAQDNYNTQSGILEQQRYRNVDLAGDRNNYTLDMANQNRAGDRNYYASQIANAGGVRNTAQAGSQLGYEQAQQQFDQTRAGVRSQATAAGAIGSLGFQQRNQWNDQNLGFAGRARTLANTSADSQYQHEYNLNTWRDLNSGQQQQTAQLNHDNAEKGLASLATEYGINADALKKALMRGSAQAGIDYSSLVAQYGAAQLRNDQSTQANLLNTVSQMIAHTGSLPAGYGINPNGGVTGPGNPAPNADPYGWGAIAAQRGATAAFNPKGVR